MVLDCASSSLGIQLLPREFTFHFFLANRSRLVQNN
jgi:hypothetical protein